MSETRAEPDAAGAWPDEFARYRWPAAELLSSRRNEEEGAGRDSLGNAGRVRTVRASAVVLERHSQSAVRRHLEGQGMKLVGSEADRAEYAEPRPEASAERSDPFLLERHVQAVVRGRPFPGQQRAVIEAKIEALRAEVAAPGADPARRARAESMLRSLEEGLTVRVEFRSLVRRFQPAVAVTAPRESLGRLLPLHAGTRIVYRVNGVDEDAGAEDEDEPMVFHVVALGSREAAVLYTGGVHGFRHIADLDDGRAHHAWFANRERVRTDATAPWIGRRVFRELRDLGASEIVIHRRRDEAPVAIERIGEDRTTVRVDGRAIEVPVYRCRTTRDDDLVVLADPESPLVLRLVESGAGVVRTIDAVVSPPACSLAAAAPLAAAAV